MTLIHGFFARWPRSSRVVVLLSAIATTGCDSGDNVLTMPEGGPASQPASSDAGHSTSKDKARTKLSSRRERLDQLEKEGSP